MTKEKNIIKKTITNYLKKIFYNNNTNFLNVSAELF